MPDLYPLARKFLFSLDAETAHHLTMSGAVIANNLGILAPLTGNSANQNAQPVKLMGLTFPNCVGLAAGLDKTGSAVAAFGAMGFGHVEVGTVTPLPQDGNPSPRLFRLKEHQAIINRMGFNNPGCDGMLENLKTSTRGFQGILGINIGKNAVTPNEEAISDYLKCMEAVYGQADYITANLSSPNTKGLRDLQNAETLSDLIQSLQKQRDQLKESHSGKHVPLVIKIAPDLDQESIASLAQVFNQTKIDGVITTNTTIAREPVKGHTHAEEAGGLSGKPLTEASLQILKWLRADLDSTIPIIGSGGLMTGDHAQAKLEAGASLVQIYTG
ncbi:MAG: quinone-dependent dihydroorotate dehydrogenase, partial [Verrucomicrobiota bacterium]